MERNNRLGLILQADCDKAFDSVKWTFLVEALKQFGLGPDFISWIRLC